MNTSKGFTLIELIIVIAVLVILLVVAIPKYMGLSDEARLATAEGFAGALTSASSVNFRLCKQKHPNCVSPITNCEGFTALLTQPTLPSGMTIHNVTSFPSTSGSAAKCEITYGANNKVEFKALMP